MNRSQKETKIKSKCERLPFFCDDSFFFAHFVLVFALLSFVRFHFQFSVDLRWVRASRLNTLNDDDDDEDDGDDGDDRNCNNQHFGVFVFVFIRRDLRSPRIYIYENEIVSKIYGRRTHTHTVTSDRIQNMLMRWDIIQNNNNNN